MQKLFGRSISESSCRLRAQLLNGSGALSNTLDHRWERMWRDKPYPFWGGEAYRRGTAEGTRGENIPQCVMYENLAKVKESVYDGIGKGGRGGGGRRREKKG